MQRFEPGETVKSLKVLFDELKIGLGEILIQTSKVEQPNKDFLFKEYPIEKQIEFSTNIAKKFGYVYLMKIFLKQLMLLNLV